MVARSHIGPLELMRTPRTSEALLAWVILVGTGLLLLQGCAEPWLRVQQVPENGYGRTINYQFQAQVHADSLGSCERIVVRVRPISKRYTKGAPPARLQLFDDDCMSPVRFERVQYLSEQTGEHVNLHGPEIFRFWSDNTRLENELIGWLWREGVI